MKTFINAACRIALIVSLMAVALLSLCGCVNESKKTITSVESMTLKLIGMRSTNVYEIKNTAGEIELYRYREFFKNGEDVLELEISASCDAQEFIDLMNTCNIVHWDGFHGKHPKNVNDGIMFDFEAVINNDQTIRAKGSENFPKGYKEFVRSLNIILAEAENK